MFGLEKSIHKINRIHAPIDQPLNLVDNHSAHIDVFLDNSHQHAADFRAHLAIAIAKFIHE